MFKYMKYELRGTYKFMLSVIFSVLLALTGIRLFGDYTMNQYYMNGNVSNSPIGGLFMALMVFLLIGSIFSTFFYLISSFRKELYEDRGYLTFTLPVSGRQILGAKLLTTIIWLVLLGTISLTYFLILTVTFNSGEFGRGIDVVLEILGSYDIISTVTIFGFTVLISAITTLLLIYLSITLSRVSIKNKKMGGLWIILFFILSSVVSSLTLKVAEIMPYYFDINSFKVISQSTLDKIVSSSRFSYMSPGYNIGMIISSLDVTAINIGAYIFSIVIAVGIFLETSYLMEKKIDL